MASVVKWLAAAQEIAKLIDAGTEHAVNKGGGGKTGEGYISLSFNTAWDRLRGEALEIVGISVYSYLLGPSREHWFESPEQALAEVKEWVRAELEEDPA